MLQRRAIHEFHGDKRLAVLLANLVDRADVGMIQRGGRARLSPEAFQSLRNLCHAVREKLQRHEPAKRRILRLIDNTHTSAAEPLDDSVVRDSLANHRAHDANVASRTLTGLKCAAAVIEEIVDMSEWSVSRTGVLLFRVEKLFKLRLQFEVIATSSFDEGSTVLRAPFQGGIEQRLQALPEFRGHIRFIAIVPRPAARSCPDSAINGDDDNPGRSSCRLVARLPHSRWWPV